MPSKKASPNQAEPQTGEAGSFESALEDLQRIVVELESGELQLTESLERYEQGIRRLKQCHQYLEAAELRISQLVGFDAEGNPVLQAIDEDNSGTLAEKQGTRQRRRTAKTASLDPPNGTGDAEACGERRSDRASMDDLPELF